MNYEDRLAELEKQIAAIQERLSSLEAPVSPAPAAAPGAADLSLLETLQSRAGPLYEDEGARGALTYAGAVALGSGEYIWQVERALPWLMELDGGALAQVLGALGSAPRLLLVRALLNGPRTSQQLQEALGVASPGQLYHHLKELLAAGVIEQRGRSNYRIAPRKIVPFLTIIMAAHDLGWPREEQQNS